MGLPLRYGASLQALTFLANTKGYDLVGCDSSGTNAFYVRKELRPATLPKQSVRDSFRKGRVTDTLNPEGNLTRITFEEEFKLITSVPLVEIDAMGKPAYLQTTLPGPPSEAPSIVANEATEELLS